MNPSLLLIPDRYKASKLYSQIPDSGAGDLAFTRANDTATRVNSAGLIEKVRTNTILYSDQFDNAYWAKENAGTGSAPIVTANNVISPDGTLNADTVFFDIGAGTTGGDFSQLNGGSFILPANPYASSIYLKTTDSSIKNMSLASPSGDFIPIVITGEWQRFQIATTNALAGGLRIRLRGNESTSSSASVAVWGAQLETGDIATPYIPTTTAAVSVGPVANIPRIDYTGGGCGKLLLEPQRTNLVTFSEQIDNASWTKQEITITANAAIAPDGTMSADKAIPTAVSTTHQIVSAALVSSSQCSFGVFAKADGYSSIEILDRASAVNGALFNLSTGTFTNVGSGIGKIENYGNGWYRCTVTATTTGVRYYIPNSDGAFLGDGVSGVLLWGAQLEAGSYATSYIPTLGASVTRSADAASKTGISSLIGSTAGTIFLDATFNAGSSNGDVFQLDGAGTGTFVVFLNGTSGNIQIYLNTSVSVLTIKSGNNKGQRHKIAISYQSGALVAYVDGVQTLSTGYTIEPALADLYLNTNDSGTNKENTILNTLALYTSALSNAELQTLTTL